MRVEKYSESEEHWLCWQCEKEGHPIKYHKTIFVIYDDKETQFNFLCSKHWEEQQINFDQKDFAKVSSYSPIEILFLKVLEENF